MLNFFLVLYDCLFAYPKKGGLPDRPTHPMILSNSCVMHSFGLRAAIQLSVSPVAQFL